MKFDIVIHNGTVVTVNDTFDVIEDGVVCVKDGTIRQVKKRDPGLPLPESAEAINARGGIILPGLVNTHSHLPMSLFRGLADDLPLMTWLNDHIFPAEAKHIHPKSVRLGSLLSCAEMLLSGTTTCCDGYFHENDVAQAVSECGIRAVLGQGVIDFPAPGVVDPKENIKHAAGYALNWKNRHANIIPSIFCHSPYTCSAKTLTEAKAITTSNGLLFQIHVAETRSECEEIRKKENLSPVAYLDSLGILDDKTLLVHCVWVDDDDMKIIAKRKSAISHCPESNMKLASGIAPVPQFLKTGITVGLGTDGCASNNTLDLFREMDTAAKLHKVSCLDPTVMDARTVLEMATINGAKAIGLGNETGSIETGKQADLIVISTQSTHLVPLYNPISHLVYCARGSDVEDVIIGGRMVVRKKTLLTTDLAHVIEEIKTLGLAIGKR